MTTQQSRTSIPDIFPEGSVASRPISYKSRVVFFLLQLSQRLGALAFFATLGAWAMLYLNRDPSGTLGLTAATALAGLCAALIARVLIANMYSQGDAGPLSVTESIKGKVGATEISARQSQAGGPYHNEEVAEARGVVAFNAVLLVLALHLMLFTRIQVIHAAVNHFLATPLDASPSHPMDLPR